MIARLINERNDNVSLYATVNRNERTAFASLFLVKLKLVWGYELWPKGWASTGPRTLD